MAIRRCPYCKAIIDEEDKYCNNCGTQLLFPEDEYVEEEIPGDKIIESEEDEEQEEEELLEEPGETDSSEEEEDEEEEEGDEEAEDEAAEEETGEELEETSIKEERVEIRPEDEKGRADLAGGGEPEEEEAEEEREEIDEEAAVADDTKKYHASIEQDELVFKTKDLENLTRTVDEGKEDLEEFLENFKEKKEEARAFTSDTKEELPPWASGMKGGAPLGDLEEEEEKEEELEEADEETEGEETEAEEEAEDEEKEEEEQEEEGEEEDEGEKVKEAEIEEEEPQDQPAWSADSGIGVPERITQTQSGLPFSDKASLAAAEDQAAAERQEGREEGETFREAHQGRGFSLRLKSKLIDLVFITALWLISLLFTSQVIGVSFFRIISGSPGSVLAFFFILLLLYFFLFLYFLGETLGDHYFSDGD